MKKIETKKIGRSLVLSCAAIIVGLCLASSGTLIANPDSANTSDEARTERVGGTYQVTAVDRNDDNTFRIEFKSTSPSGSFDVLYLDSDHVHVAVKVGQKVRLSATVLSTTDNTAEVAQVLLFLRTSRGSVPVWLLSNKGTMRKLDAARYFEMHAPEMDYIIL